MNVLWYYFRISILYIISIVTFSITLKIKKCHVAIFVTGNIDNSRCTLSLSEYTRLHV